MSIRTGLSALVAAGLVAACQTTASQTAKAPPQTTIHGDWAVYDATGAAGRECRMFTLPWQDGGLFTDRKAVAVYPEAEEVAAVLLFGAAADTPEFLDDMLRMRPDPSRSAVLTVALAEGGGTADLSITNDLALGADSPIVLSGGRTEIALVERGDIVVPADPQDGARLVEAAYAGPADLQVAYSAEVFEETIAKGMQFSGRGFQAAFDDISRRCAAPAAAG